MSKNYNYKYVVTPNKVIAISTYAGRTVKGVAKCHPNDTFDVEYGKALAAARCNVKIAAKRMARAEAKLDEAIDNYNAAHYHFRMMQDYCFDASAAYGDALIALKNLEDFEE